MDEDDAEAELRQQRFEAYLRGEILTEKERETEDTEETEETISKEKAEENSLADTIFEEEDLQNWTNERAVTWILRAKNFFEVLGIRAEQFPDLISIRNRYRKLSLLVHPDKHKTSETEVTEVQATNSFQRLSDAMRVMFDDAARVQLFQEIQLEKEHVELEMPTHQCWQPDNDQESEDSETLNGQVKDRVMQHSKLQQLLKRRKVAKSPKAGGSRRKTASASTQADRPLSASQSATTSTTSTSTLTSNSTPQSEHSASAAFVMPTLEQLTQLWQRDTEALAMAGWKRLESRRCPGHFYFAHAATGRTVMDTWERRQSRHDPNVFYFVNLNTGETSLEKT